jgi:hypothetical protein
MLSLVLPIREIEQPLMTEDGITQVRRPPREVAEHGESR